MQQFEIYLDENASASLLPEVMEFVACGSLSSGNPSSIHSSGQRTRALIEEARHSIATLVELPANARIVFTSGATEANNAAILTPLWRSGSELFQQADTAIISTKIEHPSILQPVQRLKDLGAKTALISVDKNGEINWDELEESLNPKARLISVMLANNETGHLLRVKEVFELARKISPGIVTHCDAVQAIGKLKFSAADCGADLISISGHKIGALAGCGALLVMDPRKFEALLLGGAQEVRWRAGTENIIGIRSFGIAAGVIHKNIEQRLELSTKRISLLKSELLTRIPSILWNSAEANTLPNTLSARVPGIRSDDLIVSLDLCGVRASSGAACASGKPDPSHVLLAMGYTEQQARESFRLSVGPSISEEQIIEAAKIIAECVQDQLESR